MRHLAVTQLIAVLLLASSAGASAATVPAAAETTPNLNGQLAQPLRYTPEGSAFVITNGTEFFNRPLYGGNTAFRVDAGDRPEFVLYLPGRGGNLRLGILRDGQAAWFHELEQVRAAYEPGAMVYELRDSERLGPQGMLRVMAVVAREVEGLVLRVEAVDVADSLTLFWAYGGVNGKRGRRGGDIGTEKVPIRQWFQLQPSFAEGNEYALDEASFLLTSTAGRIVGAFPKGSVLELRDANDWNHLDTLAWGASEEGFSAPVVVGRIPLAAGDVRHLGLQRLADGEEAISPDGLADLFESAEAQRASIAGRVRIDTPDLALNAAAAALCIAADAVWDERQGAVMHGAIAWRKKLLGWRGPYCMDALGWHDRARRHLAIWPSSQNLDPVPEAHAPPEEKTNLARMEAALHTRGDMGGSHYDMNLVYIDALFRHLLWTGDLEFAEEVWPVIERHLAWERRLFRREFGPDRLPLYEAYAAIWASDDLQYSGGGVAYTSAYNYWHNRQAARLARLLGRDGSAYEREASLIARAMREILWMPAAGMFAESKDLLGEQLLHTEPGLWSFYHTLDCGLPTRAEALSMTRWVDVHIPHIPVGGPGLPAGESRYVLSTTSWMPYSWSINNVTMNENIHAALAYWQAGRSDEAFRIARSALLASMFMGICPGNVGSMNYLDVYRRESQRDFADGSGVLSRALVEGLFGVRPDLLDGRLTFAPGFPGDWPRAALHHPDVDVVFERGDVADEYTLRSRLPKAVALEVQLPARSASPRVVVNGQPVEAVVSAEGGLPVLTFEAPAAGAWTFSVAWQGATVEHPAFDGRWAVEPDAFVPGVCGVDWDEPIAADRTLDPVDLSGVYNDQVSAIFERGKYRSPRSPGVSLALPAQGIGAWAGHVNELADIDDSGLRGLGGLLQLTNGVVLATPSGADAPNAAFVSQWDNYPAELSVPLAGRARRLFLLMAGSSGHMQSRLENGTVLVRYTDGSEARLPLVNPSNWWPIEQDYFIDDYQFCRPGPLPPRVDLKTGQVRYLTRDRFVGCGGPVPGGAATVLVLPLDSTRPLESLQLKARANDVVIGLLAATLER